MEKDHRGCTNNYRRKKDANILLEIHHTMKGVNVQLTDKYKISGNWTGYLPLPIYISSAGLKPPIFNELHIPLLI